MKKIVNKIQTYAILKANISSKSESKLIHVTSITSIIFG